MIVVPEEGAKENAKKDAKRSNSIGGEEEEVTLGETSGKKQEQEQEQEGISLVESAALARRTATSECLEYVEIIDKNIIHCKIRRAEDSCG